MRLQKIISEAGLSSRRGAERLIEAGRVQVNGQTITQQGFQADPAVDEITVDGQKIGPAQAFHYYMFHKPEGYLTAMSDPRQRPTIKPFLEKLPVRVFPVGRLDMDVEGLLILTNDGELAKRLMHPKYEVPKLYRAKIAGLIDQKALRKLASGVLIIGDKKAAPAKAELIKKDETKSWIFLTLTEGRHNQVKRMCSAVGHPVLKLKRVAYASLKLDPLPKEAIRPLTAVEISALKKLVGLA